MRNQALKINNKKLIFANLTIINHLILIIFFVIFKLWFFETKNQSAVHQVH